MLHAQVLEAQAAARDARGLGPDDPVRVDVVAHSMGGLLVRYYVDGETTASIAFTPPLAAGVGFDDADMAPWGTRWFGLGAGGKRPAGQAWFHNFKVPFRSSIVVTVQSPSKTQSKGFYIILRGGLDLGIDVGGVRLPDDAKLELACVASWAGVI